MKKYMLCKNPLVMSGGGKTRKHTNSTMKFMRDYNLYCKNIPFTPFVIPPVGRIIVLGDIHGDYELAIKMLKLAKLITIGKHKEIKWIGGNTYVVQVGDQIDRCRPVGDKECSQTDATYNDEDSDIKILELFTNLDLQARKQGGMVISLIGNHELMNSKGKMQYVSKKNINHFLNYKSKTSPDKVFDSPLSARQFAFSPGNEYGVFLGCTRMPSVIIGSNLFVHAGMINSIIEFLDINERSDLESINIAIKKWLLGIVEYKGIRDFVDSDSMFWTRVLGTLPPNVDFSDKLCVSQLDKVLNVLKINNVIIGHTPQSFLYNDGINSTCNNKIWRVDNGSSAAFHKLDDTFVKTGIISESRKPQVLEILNDKIFKIIK